MLRTQQFSSTTKSGTAFSSRPRTAVSTGKFNKRRKSATGQWELKWEQMLDKVSQENVTKHPSKRQYFDKLKKPV